jgi:hypothetical protein
MSGNVAKNDRLALALARGKTLAAAATEAGVCARTASRKLEDPTFRRRVADLQGEMVGRALGKMADGMASAASTLRKLLKAENESVRLGACRALLELGVKLRESVEQEQRLAEIEARIASQKAQK